MLGANGRFWVGEDSWADVTVPCRAGTLVHALACAIEVCGPMEMLELLEGWNRWSTKAGRPAPPALPDAQSWLGARAEFELRDPLVGLSAGTKPQPDVLLNAVASVLQHGALRRAELVSTLATSGVPQGTLDVFLAYSPAVRPVGKGSWDLRGRRVESNVDVPFKRGVPGTAWQWLPDGRIEVSATFTGTVNWNVPTAARPFLEARIWTSPTGPVQLSKGRVIGLAPSLHANRVSIGDRMQLSFNLVTGAVEIRFSAEKVS